MANVVRILITGKDEVSGQLDKVRDKATLLSKTDIGKGMLQGAGIAAFGMISGAADTALAAVVGFAEGSIKASSDLREAMSLNEQVFEGNSDTVAAWADKAAESFGQSKREAINFAAQFGTAFKNVGMSLDDTTAKSEELTHLAADLGSAFNASSEEAATALRSGLLGESEPLRRFGVFLDEAKVKAKAAAMGMQPLNGALTDGQKVAARYALIMEQTADSQGMFGRDSASLEDTQKSLNAELENVQATIGNELLPVMVDLTKWMRDDLVPVLKDAADWVHENGAAMEWLGHIIGAVVKGPSAEAASIFKKQQQEMADKAMEASAATAGAWDTGSERIGMAAGDAGDSLKGLATDATTSGKKVTHALDKIIWKAEDVRDALDKLGGEAADAYFDPLITKAELAANAREQAEQRAIIASKKSTKAQVEDAKLRLLELQKDALAKEVAMVGYGKMSAAEQKKFLADLKKKWASATGEAKEDIAALIKFIERIPTSRTITIYSNTKRSSDSGHGHAAGGPMQPYETSWVGENGPELFTAGAGGGRVMPSTGGTSGGGGGMTLNLTVSTPLMTPGSAQALALALEPVITRAQQQRGVVRR